MAKGGLNPFNTTLGLQASVARKRKLAEALAELGLKGSGQPYTSWSQVLGQLAQALVSNQLGRRADVDQQKVYDTTASGAREALRVFQDPNSTPEQRADAQARYGEYFPDIATKPIEAAAVDKAVPNWDISTGTAINKDDLTAGQSIPRSSSEVMNDKIIKGPDGRWQLNPALLNYDVATNLARGGYPMDPASIPRNYDDPTKAPGNIGQNGAPPAPDALQIEVLKKNMNDPEVMKWFQERYPDWLNLQFGPDGQKIKIGAQ